MLICALIVFCWVFVFRRLLKAEPVNEGWKANRGRHAGDFTLPDKLTVITKVESPCSLSHTPLVLIIVCSAVGNREERQVIRETWGGKAEENNLRVLFLIGQSNDNYLNERALDESQQYEDIIVEDFKDTYYNLTLKSIMLLKWIKLNCPTAYYVMKVDDDVYINVGNVFKIVSSEVSVARNVLLGKLYTQERPDRRVGSKWYVPNEIYSNEMYPWFLCGVGYLMSGDVALRLYSESFKHELFFIEDVFLTGICADQIGVKRQDHIGFHFFEHPVEVECNAVHPHMILLSHYVDPGSMRRIHSQMAECTV